MEKLKYIGSHSIRVEIDGKELFLHPGETYDINTSNDYLAGLIGQGFFTKIDEPKKKSEPKI